MRIGVKQKQKPPEVWDFLARVAAVLRRHHRPDRARELIRAVLDEAESDRHARKIIRAFRDGYR